MIATTHSVTNPAIRVEKVSEILKSDVKDRFSQLQSYYADLTVDYETKYRILRSIEDDVIPKLRSKIEATKEENERLTSATKKNELLIESFKKLSCELENKLENFINTSKEARKDAQQNRELLQQSFTSRVDQISTRLRSLENKKTVMNEEYASLQSDLSTCVLDFENQDKLMAKLSEHLTEEKSQLHSIGNNDDDEKCWREESLMLFEDYRSSCHKLDHQEAKLQFELAQFVDRFRELTDGLISSNKSLSEHQRRVSELEITLSSLESQQQKGKQLLLEIKRVIATETKTCANIRTSIDCMRARVDKYKNMSTAFQLNINDLENEIQLLSTTSEIAS